jgi:hypothetical protein
MIEYVLWNDFVLGEMWSYNVLFDNPYSGSGLILYIGRYFQPQWYISKNFKKDSAIQTYCSEFSGIIYRKWPKHSRLASDTRKLYLYHSLFYINKFLLRISNFFFPGQVSLLKRQKATRRYTAFFKFFSVHSLHTFL